MSHYQMMLSDGISVMSGVTRNDDVGALREATIAACDILRDDLRAGQASSVTITVLAGSGRQVGTVSVSGSVG